MTEPYNDLPREEAMKQAQLWTEQGWIVYFKFTCGSCGMRCTLVEPGVLYEKGECFACGYETELDRVGFLTAKGV